MIKFIFAILLFLNIQNGYSQNIPLPSKAQLRWHNYEQIMFVHLSPATWQGREYDNGSTPLKNIYLSKLDTDQWCEVAKSWGAKMIIFVAKHVGGFCWWQTQTTDYSIKNVSWRNGKGDVLKDLSASTKKYGLDLGVYVYPGDDQWGAGIGSGGITKDPKKQDEYNNVFRKQLTEVLTQYGTIREVWFDGNCLIPVEDIILKHASKAVIFQGKMASLRWVGNEDGIAPYPNWYTLNNTDLKSGVSTALHSDPNGNVYAPVEVDVPLLKNGGHKWFWGPDTDNLLMTKQQLIDLYYRSVGRGSVLLLNSSPDTSGLIPLSHVNVYKEFGMELDRRFANPIITYSGKGNTIEFRLPGLTELNHIVLQEDLKKGQRIRKYVIEGFKNDNWSFMKEGYSIGNKKVDYFPSDKFEKIRIRVLESADIPILKQISAYQIDVTENDDKSEKEETLIGYWDTQTYTDDWKEILFDLTPHLNKIGEYEIIFRTITYDFQNNNPSGLEFADWKLELYGRNASESLNIMKDKQGVRITRSQQTLDAFSSTLKVKIRSQAAKSIGEIILKRIVY